MAGLCRTRQEALANAADSESIRAKLTTLGSPLGAQPACAPAFPSRSGGGVGAAELFSHQIWGPGSVPRRVDALRAVAAPVHTSRVGRIEPDDFDDSGARTRAEALGGAATRLRLLLPRDDDQFLGDGASAGLRARLAAMVAAAVETVEPLAGGSGSGGKGGSGPSASRRRTAACGVLLLLALVAGGVAAAVVATAGRGGGGGAAAAAQPKPPPPTPAAAAAAPPGSYSQVTFAATLGGLSVVEFTPAAEAACACGASRRGWGCWAVRRPMLTAA